MRALRRIIIAFFSLTVFSASAEIISTEVQYKVNGTLLTGYLSYDNSISKPRPGVLVVHEWWGHNDYARTRTEMLAKQGYVAFALDMYGDGKQASHPKDASRFSSAVKKDLPLAEKRFRAALDLLANQKQTDKNKVAAIGYCFGGSIVLAMARRGVELDAVASFHGGLGLGAPVKDTINSRVLVLNGAADPFVKAEQIASFKDEMKAAKADFEFVNYPGAKHAFTNPVADQFGKKFKIPLAYHKEADEKSWRKLQDFLTETFK